MYPQDLHAAQPYGSRKETIYGNTALQPPDQNLWQWLYKVTALNDISLSLEKGSFTELSALRLWKIYAFKASFKRGGTDVRQDYC